MGLHSLIKAQNVVLETQLGFKVFTKTHRNTLGQTRTLKVVTETMLVPRESQKLIALQWL